MSAGEALKEAVLEDIKQIKAYQWIFLVLNIVFNFLVTILAVICLVPYSVELIIRGLDGDWGTRRILMELFSNSSYLVLFTLLPLILSLFVPMYRRPWFLVVYRIVQSFVGWVIIAVGSATLMGTIRRFVLSWTRNDEIWYTAFVSIVAGCVFILQGAGMFVTVLLSNILFHFFVGKSDTNNVEKPRNFAAKVIAAVLHGLEFIFAILLIIYSGFQVYLLLSDTGRDAYSTIPELVIFVVFCVCAVVSIITSGAGCVVHVATLFYKRTEMLYPAIFFGVNLGECIILGLVFAITCVAIILVEKLRNPLPTDPEADYFDSLWSIGIICLWKILLAVSGVEVVFSNFRLATSGGNDILKSATKKKKEVDISV